MIKLDEAKEIYGFRDADEREDSVTIAFLNSVRPTTQTKLQRMIEIFSPIMIIAMCLFIAMYAYNTNASTLVKAIPIIVLIVFMPSVYESMLRFRNGSGIFHDAKKLGNHFLLAYGVLQETKDESNLIRVRQTAKIKLVNGQILDNVLLIREFYDKAKSGQRIVVAMADSPQAKQLVGIFPEVYNSKVDKKAAKDDGTVKKPDGKKLRALTAEDREQCAKTYEENRKVYFKIQNKFRVIYMLIPTIVIPILSLLTDHVIFIHFSIVLGISFISMTIMELKETKGIAKEIRTSEELLITDGFVTAKPVITRGDKKIKTKKASVEIKDSTGLLIYRSKKVEDTESLQIGDEVYVIYRGEKSPVVCKK